MAVFALLFAAGPVFGQESHSRGESSGSASIHGTVTTLQENTSSGLAGVILKLTPGPDGSPSRAEEVFSDYRKVSGIEVPFKASVLRDGRPILDRTLKSVTFNTTIDPTLFQQPL